MIKTELIESLSNLQKEIKDYSEYLFEHTYHPFDKVEEFSIKLGEIINKLEDEY